MYQSNLKRPGFALSSAIKQNANNNANPSGEADQETFMNEFENVPRKQFYSAKEVKDELNEIKSVLEDISLEWERRTNALRRFRNLLIDKNDHSEVIASLKQLELAFQCSLKDLRSRIVKECCITIAYISLKLGQKCDRFVESFLQLLINLIQNSVRIMSSSAIVCLRFVIQHTHSSRFIPIISQNVTSKSKEIRRHSCELVYQYLQAWPKSIIERNASLISEDIKRGLNDADLEARAFSRKAYWAFAAHCKDQANTLFNSLDQSKRKLLQKDQVAGFSNAIPKPISKVPLPKSCLPVPSSVRKPPTVVPASPLRTTSSIDIGMARSAMLKAKTRQAFTSAMKRPNPIPVSVQKPLYRSPIESERPLFTIDSVEKVKPISPEKKTPEKQSPDHHQQQQQTSPDSGDRSRLHWRLSQSLPNSRSASPTSKFSYLTNDLMLTNAQLLNSGSRLGSSVRGRRSSNSRIPLRASGGGNSNNVSPSAGFLRSSQRSKNGSRPGSRPSSRCTSIERPNGSEDFCSMGGDSASDLNSLVSGFRLSIGRFAAEDQSDKSEASSVCSERSQTGDRHLEHVSEIIASLGSDSWSTRKDGLLSLQFYLTHSPQPLAINELQTITKLFTMMLLDPHTKTFSLFLEILNQLIRMYKDDLTDWLYVLLTRLFLKIGSDVLSSVQARVLNTLNIVRECFSRQDQFNVIIRFLSDQAQTPSMKVKLTVLQYLNDLLLQMEPSEWHHDEHSDRWHELQLCVMKIISWTSDYKSMELKSFAGEVLINMLNLNTPKFFQLLVQLPKTYQDAAYKIIQAEKKPPEEFSVLNDSYCKKMLKSVDCTMFLMPSQETELIHDDLTQEDYYSSLKKTTDEITRFTSGSSQADELFESRSQTKTQTESTFNGLIKTNNSSSIDSGISQIDGLAALSKDQPTSLSSGSSRHESITMEQSPDRSTLKKSSSSSDSPPSSSSFDKSTYTSPVASKPADESSIFYSCKKTNQSANGFLDLMNNNVRASECSLQEDIDLGDLSSIFESIDDHDKDQSAKQRALKELILKIQQKSNSDYWPKYFKKTLSLIFEYMDNRVFPETTVTALSELLINHADLCIEHIDLLMLKVLQFSKHSYKDLSSPLEHCYNVIGGVLPFDRCVSILLVTISVGDFPENQIALRMLTKFIESASRQQVERLLNEIMPPLVKAYDYHESSVRKCSVFCMVEVYNKAGLLMKPYLRNVSPSKVKLLQLYIDRANPQGAASLVA